jgi:hemolysin activation/secretion protein
MRTDEITVAALGAIEHITRDAAPLAYPARLEDVPMPVALESSARTETAASNALAAEHPAQAAVAAPAPVTTQQNVLPMLPGLLAQQSKLESASATSQPDAISTGPQLLAKADIGQRMPGPPLAPAALAQISAFDASRTVQRFEVSGSTALSRPIIDDALKAFLGVDRTDTHLQAARDALQRAHDVNGRRVKVVLPEQRERDGVARLEVREIKRYSLRIAGELRYDPVLRRNVRSDVNLDHDEPLPSLTLSRKLSLK